MSKNFRCLSPGDEFSAEFGGQEQSWTLLDIFAGAPRVELRADGAREQKQTKK